MTTPSPSLNFSSIDWSPHSFEDPGGRVFRQEGKLYRALRGSSAEAFLRMERAGLLPITERLGLVSTQRANFSLPEYDVVVEHSIVPPGPNVSEWTSTMFYDAAVLYCDLSLELARHGLQFQDSHGWNIMFHYTQPIYVDFSSIIPLAEKDSWKPFYEFINCFLHPLELIAQQQADCAFYLIGTKTWIDLDSTIPRWIDLQFRVSRKLKLLRYSRWERIRAIGGSDSVQLLVPMLKRAVARCKPLEETTRWSTYSQAFPSHETEAMHSWTAKQKNVQKVLSSTERGTLIDIGCNTGWYSVLAAKMGFDVFSLDADRSCVDQLYQFAKRNQLRITPVVASPFWPMISHGPRFYDSIQKRFVADHGLMLALVHHLFFKQGYDVRTIVEVAGSLVRKTILIEYIPVDDYWVQEWKVPHRAEDYGLDVWIQELRNSFSSIEVLPSEQSHPSTPVQRTLIWARR